MHGIDTLLEFAETLIYTKTNTYCDGAEANTADATVVSG